MNRTTEDWAANLLADTSDAMLLVWADALEEAEDPACEGVRELLVGEGKRPIRYTGQPRMYLWFGSDYPDRHTFVDTEVFAFLANGSLGCYGERNYRYELFPASRALAHYTALHDAATAYASMPEEWKRERRERRLSEQQA